MEGQEYVCISGEFYGFGNWLIEGNKDSHFFNWTFDKLKTKKGCMAYSGDSKCTVRYWQEEGCKAITKKYGKLRKKHKLKRG